MKLRLYRRLHKAGLSRARLRGGWLHGWLGDCLLDKELWLPRKNSVARACCIGFLVTLSPFFGLHIVIATVLALVFRANIPLTLALQLLVTNVFVAPFYYAGAYLFGCRVLRIPGAHVGIIKDICENFWDYFLLKKHFHHPGGAEHIFTEAVWPLFLGCTLLGVIFGVGSYLLVKLAWRHPARSMMNA